MPPRKQPSPSSDRNTAPILGVLSACLPSSGRALEIGSGSGQHAAAFARAFPAIEWLPSDPDPQARESIAAWAQETDADNLLPAIDIDVTREDWHAGIEGPLDAVLAINMVHISPWEATLGLMRGAGRLLVPGGILYLYGPYRRDGRQTSESNVRFEQWLKGLSPQYGVRDLADMEREGSANGLLLDEVIDMPANNFSLVLRKQAAIPSEPRA